MENAQAKENHNVKNVIVRRHMPGNTVLDIDDAPIIIDRLGGAPRQ
jgi:hypothetical protein